jgi:erythronate-4-phosphate dehydrogenase
VIDDACYAYHKIFSEFGEIVAMAGRDIDANSVQDADVLIVRSRTKVNQALLQDSQVKFVGSTVAGLEHVDQDYLTANNITFFSARGGSLSKVLIPINSALAARREPTLPTPIIPKVFWV